MEEIRGEVIKVNEDGNQLVRHPNGCLAYYSRAGRFLYAVPETEEEVKKKKQAQLIEALEQLGVVETIVETIRNEIRNGLHEVIQELHIERAEKEKASGENLPGENLPMEKIDWFDQIPG